MDKQIKDLLRSSKKVIESSCLKNGAIVASNFQTKGSKNYRFVWPRDAAYICLAAKILKLNIHDKFFRWLEKVENFQKAGIFYGNYSIKGDITTKECQIDQAGSILIALHDYYNEKATTKYANLISKISNGICRLWDYDHFTKVTQDLWEERLCFPDLKENFNYSVAMCYKGLSCANELIPNTHWQKTAIQLKKVILSNSNQYYYRSNGKWKDKRVDASLLGLVWPCNVVKANNLKMKKTVKLIEKNLVNNYGVHRYENDEYDGWMYKKNTHRKKGSGYWPLLNFWMSLYHIEAGNKHKAMQYLQKVLKDLKNMEFIPEQIFKNNIQVSVSPLAWSHAMFVIVCNKLGYI